MSERDALYRQALREALERYDHMAPVDLWPFIEEFGENIDELPLEKLNRWLGYVQGVLIERGITTVEAERDATRPLFRPLDFEEAGERMNCASCDGDLPAGSTYCHHCNQADTDD